MGEERRGKGEKERRKKGGRKKKKMGKMRGNSSHKAWDIVYYISEYLLIFLYSDRFMAG